MKSSRGFTVIEVLVTLSLLTVFFGFAGEVFKSTITLSDGSAEFCNRASQTDSAVYQLRRDVWNSAHLAANGKTAELASADGGEISWVLDPVQGITRIDSRGKKTRWSGIGENWSLSVEGSCLSVRDGADGLRLPSQILLWQRMRP